MKRVAMTDIWVRTVRADGGREDFADAICEGLALRVGSRTKTWSARVRVDGKRRRVTLGAYPAVGLAAARAMVADGTAAAMARGEDEAATAPPPPRRGTVGDMIAERIATLEAAGHRDAATHRSYLMTGRDNALEALGADTPAAEVTPEQVTDWLRRLHARGVNTRLPRAYLSTAFRDAMASDFDPSRPAAAVRFGITANPVAAVGGPRTSTARDRVLTREELALVWHRFGPEAAAPAVAGALLAIIAMGGVRVEEIAFARRDQIAERDGRQWITWETTKNGRPHALPLTHHAAELLHWTARLYPGPYFFPRRGDPARPVTNTALPQAVRRWCEARKIPPFQPRDLRRTMKTHLIEGWPELEALGAFDIWHNHGRNAGVVRRHYDRAEYAALKVRVAATIDDLIAGLEAPD